MIEKENNITFLHFNGKIFLHIYIYLINIDYFIFLFIFIIDKNRNLLFFFVKLTD